MASYINFSSPARRVAVSGVDGWKPRCWSSSVVLRNPNVSPRTTHAAATTVATSVFVGVAYWGVCAVRAVVRCNIASDSDAAVLQVEQIDLHPQKNGRDHRTELYEVTKDKKSPVAVLRRGLTFYMSINMLKRAFNPDVDRLLVLFEFGHRPSLYSGTKVFLSVTESEEFSREKDFWDIRRISSNTDGHCLELQIQLPHDALVGKWHCYVKTALKKSRRSTRTEFSSKKAVYVLFNPWLPDDSCFYKKTDDLKEYVLNPVGLVYTGSYRQYQGRHWVFGQFHKDVLPAVQRMLESSKLSETDRSNPVKLVRALTNMVNNTDGEGVMEGNWTSDFSGGSAPWVWTGSVKILSQYLKSDGKTVKYAQCWVYSAVLTTVCRALGLPCRSVTNFVSAHDTNGTLTIDRFFDAAGSPMKTNVHDSVWNFHVWNDVWMSRPDLPSGYGGWQAVDGTPQERSGRLFQMGPCPVEAVRRGEVGIGYDATFVFSEVNADMIHWQEDEESDWGFKKMETNNYHVGRLLVTKSVASGTSTGDETEDITLSYKNAEGTPLERISMLNAVRGTTEAHRYFGYPDERDVLLDLMEIESVMIGQPFTVVVKIENTSNEIRTVKALLQVGSVYYIGIRAAEILKHEVELVLQPKQDGSVVIEVASDKYLDSLVDLAMIKVNAIANVLETKQAWSEEDDFILDKPVLSLEVVSNDCRVGQPCEVSFSFDNPLNQQLTDVLLSYEGTGLACPSVLTINRPVGAHETFYHTETFTPEVAGEMTLVASFQSAELIGIEGRKIIEVEEAK